MVAGEGADFGAGDVGDRDGGGMGERGSGAGDELDGAFGEGSGFGQVFRFPAIDDEKEDEIVEGGGASFQLGLGAEALRELNGLAAGAEGFGGAILGVGEGELLAVAVQDFELLVDELIGVGREFPQGEVDAGGDDGRAGVAVDDERRVEGVGVCVDGGLPQRNGAGQGGDSGDVAGGIDVDLKLDGAFDARGASLGGVDDVGWGEGLVVDGGGRGRGGCLQEGQEHESDHGIHPGSG